MTVTMKEASRVAERFSEGDTSWLDMKGYANVREVSIDEGFLFIDCKDGIYGCRIEDSGIVWRVTI